MSAPRSSSVCCKVLLWRHSPSPASQQRCDATYSRVEGAMETLEALGKVYTQEIVVPMNRRAFSSWSSSITSCFAHRKQTQGLPLGAFPAVGAQHLKNPVSSRASQRRQTDHRSRTGGGDQITGVSGGRPLRGSSALEYAWVRHTRLSDTFGLSGMLCLLLRAKQCRRRDLHRIQRSRAAGRR